MFCDKCNKPQEAFIIKNKRGETRTYCAGCQWSRLATREEVKELNKLTRKQKSF